MFPENNDFYFYNSTHFSRALVTKTVRSEQFSRNNMFTHLPVYQMCVWATEACVVFRLKRQVQCFWARTWDVTVLLWCQQSKSSKSQVLIKCQCVKRRRKREKEWWLGGGGLYRAHGQAWRTARSDSLNRDVNGLHLFVCAHAIKHSFCHRQSCEKCMLSRFLWHAHTHTRTHPWIHMETVLWLGSINLPH